VRVTLDATHGLLVVILRHGTLRSAETAVRNGVRTDLGILRMSVITGQALFPEIKDIFTSPIHLNAAFRPGAL